MDDFIRAQIEHLNNVLPDYKSIKFFSTKDKF